MIFINVVLPAFLIFATGFILMKRFPLDIRSFSRVTFYGLLPVLVFRTLYEVELGLQFGKIIGIELLLTFLLIVVVKIWTWIRKESHVRQTALILSTVFMNSGNYGSPIILFAFGEEGFRLAIAFWVLNAILMNSVGVYFAAKGKGGIRESLQKVLEMPVLYATLLGIVMGYTQWAVPTFLWRSIDLMADAALPVMMLTLGMQLAKVRLTSTWKPMSEALVLRLAVSPLIALLLLKAFQVEGLLFNVILLQSAMPSAVATTLLSIEYDREPELVSNVTLVSTILSIGTISLLLYILA